MKCYRVWFKNGSACLVNARDEKAAIERALSQSDAGSKFARVEDLG